jgi:predicted RNA-binding protein YlqC (UPF0109 family)
LRFEPESECTAKLDFLATRGVKMPKSAPAILVCSSELTESTANVIRDTVKLLVKYPKLVRIEARPGTTSVALLLRVAPDDAGIVIGKQGRTARSLRVLLNSISKRNGVPFELDIHAEQL